ncbi:MAG: rRNA pseudouridine synthase [Chloroflexota bacterium]|nr:MAG: rRNA pseudouridine synthase [Chloroflexota bacterium]
MTAPPPGEGPRQERLQRTLARAGLCSRRGCEELIRQGRVTVDGRVVSELGTKVDPRSQRIAVDGRPIQIPEEPQYYVMNKPVGYVTTVSDPHGRPTVIDLLRSKIPSALAPGRRVFPVGRLDLDSEGLLILTDDGDLAYRMTHPRHELEKEYLVNVAGRATAEELAALRRGVVIDDIRTAPARVTGAEPLHGSSHGPAGSSWLRIVIREGRKRQVRRMCEAVGHPVLRLMRVRIGPLPLGSLPSGAVRPMTPAELTDLRRALGLSGSERA